MVWNQLLQKQLNIGIINLLQKIFLATAFMIGGPSEGQARPSEPKPPCSNPWFQILFCVFELGVKAMYPLVLPLLHGLLMLLICVITDGALSLVIRQGFSV